MTSDLFRLNQAQSEAADVYCSHNPIKHSAIFHW